ncbi:MAG: RICIN domain-containing protein [Clostridia bacterium]
MKRVFLCILALVVLLSAMPISIHGEDDVMLPKLKEKTYNMNFDWKFTKTNVAFPLKDAVESMVKDGKQFYEVDYDDSLWETVSVPHAPNASDSFDNVIKDAGEASLYRGYMMYRKHFTLESVENKKFIIEFEAIRQTIYLYINGNFVGYYEHGTAPVGFDISSFVKEGDNLIALITDNAAYRGSTFTTVETIPGNTPGDGSGVGYQWNQKDFNEVQGGITGNVNLYVKPLVYQTKPLYNNLKTTGNYIYPSDFDFNSKTATINVKAEVRNESDSDVSAKIGVYIAEGDKVIAHFESKETTVPVAKDKGEVFKTVVPQDAYSETPSPTNAQTSSVTYISASASVSSLTFWSIDNPHLYDVYTTLIIDGEEVDTECITTGFRKVEYDIDNGGLLINGESVYLKGYAQRSTNEWAVIGVANDWLTDYDMHLVRQSGSNFIRWMHVTPKPVAIRSCDKYGVVSVCPAGDKEGDTNGRTWDMRMESMRDAIIYFRNSPSVIFYEAGNAAISAEHMQEMTDMKNLLDPKGYRFMGCRSITSPEQIKAAEWAGTMIYRYDEWAKSSMATVGKFIPILETEYKRDESPRRVWDDYSPPHYDYLNKWLGDGAKKTDGYDVWDQTQEEFSVYQASSYDGYSYFYNNRVGGLTGKDYYSGAAIMVWSDSNMHGRNAGSENCRTSGKVDPVRIKKPVFYAMQVMQSDTAMVHIVGHWNYPENSEENYNYHTKEWNGTYWEVTDNTDRRDPTDKTVYVFGSEMIDKIELYVNGGLVGTNDAPYDNYVYEFPHIDVTQSGYISAIGYNSDGDVIAKDKIVTAGEVKSIRLTPYTGPDGLIADGSDVCYFDVEIVDEDGNVCPLAYDRIDFTLEGDGVFLGGYNSGTFDETSVIHKDYCYAENGVNRVFVQSVPRGNSFTLTATAQGLESASVTLSMTEFSLINGMTELPQRAEKVNTFKIEREDTLFNRLVLKNIKKTRIPSYEDNTVKYIIKNVGTNKALTVTDGALTLTDFDENDESLIWTFENVGGEAYTIKHGKTLLAIDVPARSKEPKTALIVYGPNGGDNQKWIIQSEENGYVRLISKSSNLSMEISEGKVIQNKPDNTLSAVNQKWQLIKVDMKDTFKVIVNGEEVKFTTKPYKPDTATGVLCEVRPVLDALGAQYTYETQGKVKLTIMDSGASLTEGETTISIGDETNLTNAEFFVQSGELIAEISAVMEYVSGVSVQTDLKAKTVTITK